jgi:hypothetical protein
VFTIPIQAFTMADLGVHDGLKRVVGGAPPPYGDFQVSMHGRFWVSTEAH